MINNITNFRYLSTKLCFTILVMIFASLTISNSVLAHDPDQHGAICDVSAPDRIVEEGGEDCKDGTNSCKKGGGECIDPAPAEPINRISSYVGNRPQSYDKQGNPVGSTGHKGMDYAAGIGVPVYAGATGSSMYKLNVTQNGNKISGYGNYILITHSKQKGYFSIYGHLHCIAKGFKGSASVKKGQFIGRVGNTGGSSGPHLHYEVRKSSQGTPFQGEVINPLNNESLCKAPEKFGGSSENVDAGSSSGGGAASGGGTAGGATGATGGSGAQSDANGRDCDPKNYTTMLQTCLFCDLFVTAFNTASRIAKLAYDVFAPAMAKLVGLGMAIWIALTILKYISSLEQGGTNAAKLIKTLMNRSFVAIIAVGFLTGSSNGFFTQLMEPIFNTGFELARLAMDSSVSCAKDYGVITAANGGGLPYSMGSSIVCTIEALQEKILNIMALGSTSMCIGLYVKSFMGIPLFFNIAYTLSGVLLWAGGLALLIIFPFLLLDSVLQLAVACALLPFAIASYVFPVTKQYSSKVWATFMSAMFNFIFLAILISILTKAIQITLDDNIQTSLINRVLNEGVFEGLLEEIGWQGKTFLKVIFILLLSWAVLEEANKLASSFGGGGFSSDIGRSVGGTMASGPMNLGKKVGTWGVSQAKKGAQNVGGRIKAMGSRALVNRRANKINRRMNEAKEKGVRNEDGSYTYKNKYGKAFTARENDDGSMSYSHKSMGGKTITQSVNNEGGNNTISKTVQDKYKEGDDLAVALKLDKARREGTLNPDGSMTYKGKFSGTEYTVSQNEDGTYSYSYKNVLGKIVTKSMGNRNKTSSVETIKDANKVITITRDKNGNVIGEETKLIGANAQKLVGKYGEINQNAIDAIMSKHTVMAQQFQANQAKQPALSEEQKRWLDSKGLMYENLGVNNFDDISKAFGANIQAEMKRDGVGPTQEQSAAKLSLERQKMQMQTEYERSQNAIMKQIFKERMPSVNGDTYSAFANRDMKVGQDQNGNNIFETIEKKADGSQVKMKMTMINGRVLTEQETIGRDGTLIRYASDGIVHKRTIAQVKDGQIVKDSIKSLYQFDNQYTKYVVGAVVDIYGKPAKEIPLKNSLFDQNEINAALSQHANNRRQGLKNPDMSAFRKNDS